MLLATHLATFGMGMCVDIPVLSFITGKHIGNDTSAAMKGAMLHLLLQLPSSITVAPSKHKEQNGLVTKADFVYLEDNHKPVST